MWGSLADIAAETKALVQTAVQVQLAVSVAVLAEISLRSPRKLFILIIQKCIFRSKVSPKKRFGKNSACGASGS